MPRFGARALLLAFLSLSLGACQGRSGAHKSVKKSAAAGAALAGARSRAKPELAPRGGSQAPLEQFVQQHVEEADASGQRVLVYVGATWCEPCKRFHKALASGQLDESLAGTKFVEFDADRDREELRAAGYASKYIPLFSVPDQSGHASGRAIEGSVKGDSAVRENLVPRLLALLDGKPVD
ncbi:MAG: thioredoxin [Myxococcales bacterium]|nr:MAG: thioredoxin [Myxococcales bacterium]